MKLPDIKILDEKNKILHSKSQEMKFPLSDKEKKDINDMIEYLKMSQIDEEREKYDLRAGMGLAYVQIGVPKRAFVIVDEIDEGVFETHIVINPKIISESQEMVFVGEGEGCLSVNRDVEGIVPRHARITVKAFDIDGNEYTIRVREDIAVAYQHEIDHLNGILFPERIDKKNPYKNMNSMREI